jgi:hypothetical protein
MKANDALVDNGGKRNIKQTILLAGVLLPAAVVWGGVHVSNGKVFPGRSK